MITQKLVAAFQPESLMYKMSVTSMLAMPGGKKAVERISSLDAGSCFAGKSRLQRHRLVNQVLADELASSIHALQLHLSN